MEWNGEGGDCGMLKIAVVEDQQEVRDELCWFIRQYAAENSLQAEVLPVEDGTVIAEHYEPGYDIIFMDVEMPGLDGFGAAEKIRAVDADAVLVFVTNMAQYAIKGYEVDALDFIVKPADQGSINYVLDKAMKRLEGVSNAAFALKTSDGIVSLSTNDIIYVEVFDHNLVYHTTKGNYDIRGRLSDVMKRLDPKRFIMCNRSYVVNLRYVSNINNDFLVVDGTQISISKSHRKEILQHFSNFLGENL